MLQKEAQRRKRPSPGGWLTRRHRCPTGDPALITRESTLKVLGHGELLSFKHTKNNNYINVNCIISFTYIFLVSYYY